MKLGEKIRHYREGLGMTLDDLAERSGVDRGTISALENRKSERSKYAASIAAGFGVTLDQLIGKTDFLPSLKGFQSLPNIGCGAELLGRVNKKAVRVSGTLQGGDGGYLEFEQNLDEGSIDHYSTQDSDSYAMRVRGDSMAPRIRHGEYVVVEPHRLVLPGDDVAIEMKDGRRMVKTLLYERDGEIVLASINNGHGNITVARGDVAVLHAVAAIYPRASFRAD